MGKFLAIFNGAADENDKVELTDQQQSDFLTAWAAWANAHEGSLTDPGAPLFRKKRISARGVEDFEDAKVAYAVVEAATHDDAAQIFNEHPHLSLDPGNSIEVIECPGIAE